MCYFTFNYNLGPKIKLKEENEYTNTTLFVIIVILVVISIINEVKAILFILRRRKNQF